MGQALKTVIKKVALVYSQAAKWIIETPSESPRSVIVISDDEDFIDLCMSMEIDYITDEYNGHTTLALYNVSGNPLFLQGLVREVLIIIDTDSEAHIRAAQQSVTGYYSKHINLKTDNG